MQARGHRFEPVHLHQGRCVVKELRSGIERGRIEILDEKSR